MKASNPIHFVKQLYFNSKFYKQYGMPAYPQCLRVSPNGQYFSVNSHGSIYIFNLKQPDNSWQSGIKIREASIVTPTDSGGYWVLDNDKASLISANNTTKLDFSLPRTGSIWGNDDWFASHYEKQLSFTNLSNLHLHKVKFNKIILHIWKQGNELKILSISNKVKKLYLHCWSCDAELPILQHAIKFPYDFRYSGCFASYPLNGPIHAWSDHHGTITVKLMPWAVSISHKNKIAVLDDYVYWSPIMHGGSTIKHQKLVEITAIAMDAGLDPMMDYGAIPYLITTLQHNDYIHIITSHWHKKISISNIGAAEKHFLNTKIDDPHIAAFILKNSGGNTPISDNMFTAIIELLRSKKWQKIYHTTLQPKEHQIASIIKRLLPELILKTRNNILDDIEISAIHDAVENFSKYPEIAATCYEALNDPNLNKILRQCIISKLSELAPVLSTKVRKLIPKSFMNDTFSLKEILPHANLETAQYLLKKVPESFFSLDYIELLLERFHGNHQALELIVKQYAPQWCHDKSLPLVRLEKINQSMTQAINLEPYIVLLMLRHNITLPKNMNHPYVKFIRVMTNHKLSIKYLLRILINQSNSNTEPLFSLFIKDSFEYFNDTRFIPDFIQMMAKLNCAVDRNDLLSLADDASNKIDRAIVAHIWNLSDKLAPQYRKAYAIVLLEATKRCLGEGAETTLTTKGIETSQQLSMTNEALLLQANKAIKDSPMDEMLKVI